MHVISLMTGFDLEPYWWWQMAAVPGTTIKKHSNRSFRAWNSLVLSYFVDQPRLCIRNLEYTTKSLKMEFVNYKSDHIGQQRGTGSWEPTTTELSR